MKYKIEIKPDIAFPRSLADIVKTNLLEADKEKIAEWLENLPDETFISVFTQENRKLLAQFLRGKIKKKRGRKATEGFSDYLIWLHYADLRNQGLRRGEAITKTAEAFRKAAKLPENDLFRQACDRDWDINNIEENIEEIITKLDKCLKLSPAE